MFFITLRVRNPDYGNLLVLQKNSIIDNYLKPDINHALVPCVKEECPRWKGWEGRGGCILLVKAGSMAEYKQ
jgi:hypothetical protein